MRQLAFLVSVVIGLAGCRHEAASVPEAEPVTDPLLRAAMVRLPVKQYLLDGLPLTLEDDGTATLRLTDRRELAAGDFVSSLGLRVWHVDPIAKSGVVEPFENGRRLQSAIHGACLALADEIIAERKGDSRAVEAGEVARRWLGAETIVAVPVGGAVDPYTPTRFTLTQADRKVLENALAGIAPEKNDSLLPEMRTRRSRPYTLHPDTQPAARR